MQQTEILSELGNIAAESLGKSLTNLNIDEFLPLKGVEDETLKFLVSSFSGERLAVIMLSTQSSPMMVQYGVDVAVDAANRLGDTLLGHVPLLPLASGEIQGLTYAITPYVQALSGNKIQYLIQRFQIKGKVLEWLRGATVQTLSELKLNELEKNFVTPLEYVKSLQSFDASIRKRAQNALEEIHSGIWCPKHVLMHGDLWTGNIMIDNRPPPQRSETGFVVIDWASGCGAGYGFYDLIRIVTSLNCSEKLITKEFKEHLDIFECSENQALYYLLSGVGYIGLTSTHFAEDRYIAMTERCIFAFNNILSNLK